MKSIGTKLIVVILLILSFACQDEEVFLDMPESVRPHYDQFFIEARERGVDLNEKTVFFVEKATEDMNGYTAYAVISESSIYIDSAKFNNFRHFSREYIIFHELGHYILRRPHTYIRFEDGTPMSIMDGEKGAYNDNKRLDMRSYYLDELLGDWR